MSHPLSQKDTLMRPHLNLNGKRPILEPSNLHQPLPTTNPNPHHHPADERLPFDIFLNHLSKRSRTSQSTFQSPAQPTRPLLHSLRPTPNTQPSSSQALTHDPSLFAPPPPPQLSRHTTQRRSLLPPSKQTRLTTPTTNVIPPALALDKDARVNREKQRNKDELRRETLQWQEKYRVAIKSFVFYLDRLDSTEEASLTSKLAVWGARVDQFFSKDVTHVITNLPVPANLPLPSPSATASKRGSAYQPPPHPSPSHNKENGPLGTSRRLSKKPDRLGHTISPEKDGHLTDAVTPIDPLLRKALEMKIKIWRTEKLLNVLSRLQDHRSPVKPAQPTKPSLPSLLLKEAQQGHTHERDPVAARPDYHYFSSKSFFILVEDAIQEHKPILVKEFSKPKSRETTNWPILYGGTEGKSAFSRYTAKHSITHVQTRIRQMLEERAREQKLSRSLAAKNANQGGSGLMASVAPQPTDERGSTSSSTASPAHHIRRAMSMNMLQRRQSTRLQQSRRRTEAELVNLPAPEHHRGPGKVFMAASGNSVALTSAAPSTTTRSSMPHRPTSGPFLIDKRLAALSKRPTFQIASSTPSSLKLSLGPSTATTTTTTPAQVCDLKRAQSLDGAMMAHEKLKKPIRRTRGGRKGLGVRAKLGEAFDLLDLSALAHQEEPKPGYCENCRAKYPDFKRHVITRRHRRFARDEENWWELDQLLRRTTRVLKPNVILPPSVQELLRQEEVQEEEEEEEHDCCGENHEEEEEEEAEDHEGHDPDCCGGIHEEEGEEEDEHDHDCCGGTHEEDEEEEAEEEEHDEDCCGGVHEDEEEEGHDPDCCGGVHEEEGEEGHDPDCCGGVHEDEEEGEVAE